MQQTVAMNNKQRVVNTQMKQLFVLVSK